MRRRTAHMAFGAVTALCAAFSVFAALRLHEAREVNAAIVEAARTGTVHVESALPEAEFARALFLARRGEYEAAINAYRAIVRGDREDLAVAALYNIGNLHLREALKGGPDGTARSLPLIELAKQSYRSALRREPNAWDARYNLERALWLVPEIEEPVVDTIKRDAEQRVMSTLQGTRGDLP